MALKDWKKVKGYMNTWSNSKIDKMISIYDAKEFWGRDSFYSKLYKYKYGVDVSSNKWPLSVLIRNSFKTKKEALKYARAYMRKH